METEHAVRLHHALYWLSLFVLLIANLFVSILLIPVLFMISGWFLYAIVVSLGLVVGMIFSFMITNIEHLERKHHVAALLFIPGTAVLNIFLISSLAKRLAALIQLPLQEKPLLMAAAYVAAFLLPYAAIMVRRR